MSIGALRRISPSSPAADRVPSIFTVTRSTPLTPAPSAAAPPPAPPPHSSPSLFRWAEMTPATRPAFGVGEGVVGAATRGHREDRRLRHPIARHDTATAELRLDVVVQLRRLRRAAA